jgi:U3 small nucleolar RNA-associated protein 18
MPVGGIARDDDDLLFEEEESSKATKRARPASDAPAWHDDEDDGEQQEEASAARHEQELREKYEERRGPRPAWAQRTADEGAQGSTLFSTTANLTKSGPAVGVLEPGALRVQKLANLNALAPSTVEVDNVQFAPGAQVALTAGRDKTLRLFQVNEKKCVKLHSIFFEDLPIKRAQFVPRSSDVLCMGYKKPFYVYDMEHDAVTRIPHLIGQLEGGWADVVQSPDGVYSTFLGGESGNVVLFSNRSRQVAHTLKASGPMTRAVYGADSGSPYLWTTGPECEVFKWDMRSTRRCVAKFRDHGGIGTEAIANSPDGRWQAIGDKSGVVNIYSLSDEHPGTPHKAIGNLVTAATMLKWNHDSQMLTIASPKIMGALRVVHVPSFTVFANWPMDNAHLQFVSSVDVSPSSGYLSVGNRKGQAQLFRLLSYPRY